MSNYLEYRFRVDAERRDILLAYLSRYPFDTFQETETGLSAYTAPGATPDRDAVATRTAPLGATFTVHEHAPENWNARWEANFPPLRVGNFCGIRADFHPPTEGVRFDLVIHPKMAFGTGHHATTHQMVETLEHLDLAGKRVLDYGCGTGVLAILAKQLGAAYVHAVDIEAPAYENTLENAARNGVRLETVRCGTLATTRDEAVFDVILANINRNVILASLPELAQRCAPGGVLLTSGYLRADAAQLDAALEAHGFARVARREREGWLCTHSRRWVGV